MDIQDFESQWADAPEPDDPQPLHIVRDSAPRVELEAEGSPEGSETISERFGTPQDRAQRIEDIERGFWESRTSLQMIYTTALSRMCSPWSVLAHCAARALTQVRPHIMLPSLIGGPGSLNWFAAVVARSSGGKGASTAAARLLVPGHVDQRNVGSGEGMVAAFGRTSAGEQTPDSLESIMFTADEVDTLTALNNRSGSQTMGVLRSAFSGESLGWTYLRQRHVPEGEYRLTLVVSVQPERAVGLMSDAAGGTPQRFMWFPAEDARVTTSPPNPTESLELPRPREWQYPRELTIPPEARELILSERVKNMRGEVDALDGHALFCREKFAFALAVLDGRVDMSLEDWELSGIAAEMSAFTRESVMDEIRTAARRDASERGVLKGIEMDAADIERANQQAERMRRVLRGVIKRISDAGEIGVTAGDLRRSSTSRDRECIESALEAAERDGLIRRINRDRPNRARWVAL